MAIVFLGSSCCVGFHVLCVECFPPAPRASSLLTPSQLPSGYHRVAINNIEVQSEFFKYLHYLTLLNFDIINANERTPLLLNINPRVS